MNKDAMVDQEAAQVDGDDQKVGHKSQGGRGGQNILKRKVKNAYGQRKRAK